MGAIDPKALFDKIASLPNARLAEVEAFIDAIARREQDQALVHAASAASAPAFSAVWSNPEDDVYDAL